jgi:hypothetical protein
MAMVDGVPAITDQDNTINRLSYVKANDADGMNWGDPITVDLRIG